MPILSLIASFLACMFLIKHVDLYWITLVFVYIPTAGIIVRKMLDKKFAGHLVFDKQSGIYSLKPEAPRFFRWYSSAMDLFLGMLIGFSFAYFFAGGWTR